MLVSVLLSSLRLTWMTASNISSQAETLLTGTGRPLQLLAPFLSRIIWTDISCGLYETQSVDISLSGGCNDVRTEHCEACYA